MTVPSRASSSARSAVHDFRLWPGDYEELRDEARGVVKATMEMMMSRIGALPGPSASAADPAASVKAARENMMLTLANPVPEGESREIAERPLPRLPAGE
jgi:hypothetical protein